MLLLVGQQQGGAQGGQVEREKVVNQEEANQFLEANKAKEGIVTLDSGMQYKVISSGEGDKKPGPTDPVPTETGLLFSLAQTSEWEAPGGEQLSDSDDVAECQDEVAAAEDA